MSRGVGITAGTPAGTGCVVIDSIGMALEDNEPLEAEAVLKHRVVLGLVDYSLDGVLDDSLLKIS